MTRTCPSKGVRLPRASRWCTVPCIAAAGWLTAFSLHAEDGYNGNAKEESRPPWQDALPLDWYFFVAAVNVYPRLESEDLVHDVYEPILGMLSPGHRGVQTISDLRDDHLLWPPHLGLGVNLNRHWSLFVEAGYTSGKVRTKNDRPSIFLLPLHTDFEIQRAAAFVGVGLDYFPWAMPEQRAYRGFWPRLAGARPFLGTRFTWTHATYDAKVKLGFRPFPNLVSLELSDAWSLPSTTVVGGIDIPLTEKTTVTINGGYNFFWRRDLDFEGYAFTIQWRRYFNGPGIFPRGGGGHRMASPPAPGKALTRR